MDVRSAKDFLVQQTARQASLDGVALSELEKRMMRYTEGRGATDDDLKLIQDFDSQCKTEEYEAKIGKLLRHALARLNKENPEQARTFRKAMDSLAKSDHYLTVLWEQGPKERPPHDQLKLLAAGLTIAAALLLVQFYADRISPQFARFIHDPVGRRVFFYGLFIGSYGAYYFVRQKLRNRY